MNVLITCAGRRSQTVMAFRDALGGRGLVLACDSNQDAPALQGADRAFVVPNVDDNGYVDALIGICIEHRVDLLIPALEIELPILALNQPRFARIGTRPMVSSRQVIDTCFDKLKTAEFLATSGLMATPTFASLPEAKDALARDDLAFPVIVKPRWGVSSIETEFAYDLDELGLAYALVRKRLARTFLAEVSEADREHCVLIQQKLSGTEYGLDIVNDFKGRYVCTFAKRKLRMWAGQTDRAVTVQDQYLQDLGQHIGQDLGHIGILDCDVFVTGDEHRVIDLNPRFGGGYPFSQIAGANLPAAMLAWVEGDEPDPEWFKVLPNVVTARTDAFVIIDRTRAQPWPRSFRDSGVEPARFGGA